MRHDALWIARTSSQRGRREDVWLLTPRHFHAKILECSDMASLINSSCAAKCHHAYQANGSKAGCACFDVTISAEDDPADCETVLHGLMIARLPKRDQGYRRIPMVMLCRHSVRAKSMSMP